MDPIMMLLSAAAGGLINLDTANKKNKAADEKKSYNQAVSKWSGFNPGLAPDEQYFASTQQINPLAALVQGGIGGASFAGNLPSNLFGRKDNEVV
jgi:hypothetical protein